MAKTLRSALLLAGAAALLGACADYPYYDNGYGYYDNNAPAYGYYDNGPAYGYNYAPGAYYDPYPSYYAAPAIGLGFSWSDRDYHHGDRHEWREHHHEWHGGGGGEHHGGTDDHGSGG